MTNRRTALEQAADLGYVDDLSTSLEAITRLLADDARKHLTTIRRGWPHVLDPIRTTGGSTRGATADTLRPETEDDVDVPPDARWDTPPTLAFWVRAAIDQWPTLMQTLQPGPDGNLRLVTTETIDCSSVPAMTAFLDREAERLAGWVDDANDYGARFLHDLERAARAVARVAWPPKGDRITIGDCPTCGRRVRVKAPVWRQKPIPHPVPTTDPDVATHGWVWIVTDDSPWAPERDAPMTCRCGESGTVEEWREKLVGPAVLMTADEIVVDIRDELGMRYQPAVLRQWARRGMITGQGYSPQGHALYDRTQVFAALIAREKQRAS